ncbi:alpha/beta hydrolase family protein [Hugenholtzia roseola]|uniref:alpha/beta hydrolase family protein n=1 Tax=Hugenholtzia roseola TaxID=1002 RepID=UPI00040DEF8D|nr:alpha/beta fold hydrolase [Hugenholtzia roseola]
MGVKREAVSIKNEFEQNNSLIVNIFSNQSEKPRGSILIIPATAVKQSYYKHFATYLANENLQVFTFDYAGIGESKQQSITKVKNTLHDWAKDANTVLNYIIKNYKQPIVIIGHSIGAQFVGFHPTFSLPQVLGIYCISLQSGYLGHAPTAMTRLQLTILYRLLIPFLTTILGYFPAKKLKLGEDLPRRVASQFAEWCSNPKYNLDFLEKNPDFNHFKNLKKPVFLLNFSDDEWGTRRAIAHLLPLFANCAITQEYINVQESGQNNKIGHMGFFNPKTSKIYWANTLNWINQKLNNEKVLF